MAVGNAPQSVNWYIEVIKWILGIAAGMLVFAFDKMKTDGWPHWLTISYLASAALLALAIVLGIFACWQWLPYANRLEMGHAATDAEPKRLAELGTLFYAGMATSFFVGVVLFAVVWVASFLRGPGSVTAAELQLIPAGSPTSFLVVKQLPGAKSMQVLSRDGPDSYVWKTVDWPSAP